MKLQGTFLRSRIARRIFLLFVLSAAVPMGVMALLSVGEVNKLLITQSRDELTRFSTSYGMAMYERLLLLEEALRQLAPERKEGTAPPSTAASIWRERFLSLGIALPDGQVRAFMNTPAVLPALSERQEAHLRSGKSLLIATRTEAGSVIIMLAPVDAASVAGAIWVAELAPDYVWGRSESLPSMTDLCVLDESNRPLYCSRPTPDSAFSALSAQVVRNSGGQLDWTEGGERYVAGYYGVFLRPQFFLHSWTVVASQSESETLAALAAFKGVFLPAIGLSILLVGMLSVTQIRRTLVPLERLIDATRRIAAQDFTSRVEVQRKDEFGELAASFNGMTARLGRQFHALSTLSEIDKVILSTLDVDRVLDMVLARLRDIVPADFACITVVDGDSAREGRCHIRDYTTGAPTMVERTHLAVQESAQLIAAREAFWIERADASVGYLAPLARYEAGAFFVLPVLWQDKLTAVIVLAYRARPTLSADEEAHARDFRDRLGVALSTAARDEQLYFQARYDALTRLPNRLHFKDQLAQELAHAARDGSQLAVLFVDLDHFKNVNDTAGHAAGDALLIQAAARLKSCVRQTDTVARLGGDEFTIILTALAAPQAAASVAEHVVKTMAEPFLVDGVESFLSVSVGIAVYPTDGASGDELVKNADTAMYRAKAAGRGRCVYFEERMNAEAMARVTLERELRRAIEREEFELVYQPQLDAYGEHVSGAEALIRWNHPQRGLLSPFHFIGVVEDVGLIDVLGRWIVRAACRQFKALQAAGLRLERVSVNVSTRQFKQRDFAAFVRSTLEELDVPPRCLELEMTESALMESGGETQAMLHELSELGVRLALDDFGTGYSSLAYLKRFPVDIVKIDRSFVNDIDVDSESRAIVAAIIAMSHTLRKEVIAEGVETEEQLSTLRTLGCDHIQGYYFSKPLAATKLAEFLRQRAPARC